MLNRHKTIDASLRGAGFMSKDIAETGEIAAKPPSPKPPSRMRARINRFAAALTHVVFVLAIALVFIRGGEPQATVKDAGAAPEPAAKSETARLQDAPARTTPVSPLPDGLRGEPQGMDGAGEGSAGEGSVGEGSAGEGTAEQPGSEFQGAARSRRSRREREREREEERQSPPAELAQPLPAPQRSARDQARANRLMARLVSTYPDFLTGHDDNNLIWRDGAKMGFDDGAEKTFQERLERADVEDQFTIPYPLGEMLSDPEVDFDPGRIRNTAFLTKMYGDCRRRGEVDKKLVDVIWLPKHGAKKIRATPVNKVAEKMQLVSNELDALPEEMQKYLRPIAGTYNCRDVANTSRSSAHAFGIAIDLNSAFGDYWEWSGRRRSAEMPPYRNRIPNEIVAVFEKHGFIWGGKWFHFDTAHFEYRPELLIADEESQGDMAVPMPEKQPRNLN